MHGKGARSMEGLMRHIERYQRCGSPETGKKLGLKTVVTVLPDTAERYFSTPLFED